jgi:hypothetical protein
MWCNCVDHFASQAVERPLVENRPRIRINTVGVDGLFGFASATPELVPLLGIDIELVARLPRRLSLSPKQYIVEVVTGGGRALDANRPAFIGPPLISRQCIALPRTAVMIVCGMMMSRTADGSSTVFNPPM